MNLVQIKKVFKYGLILFFALTFQLSGQWIVQNSGTTKFLKSVDFIDNLNGWTVGDNGTVLRTTNSGNDWLPVNPGIIENFYSVFFADSQNGWIAGDAGTILRTTNSGDDWFLQNSGTTSPLSDVFFTDENNGWIAAGTEVLRTTDGGESWNPYTTGSVIVHKIFFTSELNGWAAGSEADLARTTDGGLTWFNQPSGTDSGRSNIFFVDNQTGWTVGGHIMTKTTNGGNSWIALQWNFYEFTSTFFIDEETGWSVAYWAEWCAKIFKSTDGGDFWDEEFDLCDQHLVDITFADPANGWAVGENGLIVKYDLTKQLTIIQPNGGEHWLAENPASIQWQSNNVELFSLFFSSNSGQDWQLIEDSLRHNYYWWDTPFIASENCLVKVVDYNDPNIFDISDSVFSIIIDPYIFVELPDGGEILGRGGTFNIEWWAQHVHEVNILFSADAGESWEYIINNVNSEEGYRSYTWNVPDTTSELCLIKIESSSDPAVYDISDQYFRIIDIPPVSYFPLNVGNSWYFSELSFGPITFQIEIQKDTVLDDNNTYAKFRKIKMPENLLLYEFYLRKENNKIISYPDNVILDSNNAIGDTVTDIYGYPAVLNDIDFSIVLGRYLTTYYFQLGENSFYSYTDSIGFINRWTGNTFQEQLRGCIIDGVTYGVTGVDEEINTVPNAFNLFQNYPNPFNPLTTIRYSVPEMKFIALKVYDVLGNEITTLVKEEKPAGTYEVKWNATTLPSGIYFYQLTAEGFVETKKMILLK